MPIGSVPPPEQHPDEQPIVCIPVNVEWIPILLGALQPLKYPEYWSGTLEENRRARKDFGLLLDQIMQAEDCGVDNCCVPPYVIKRIDPATGFVQISTNNGTTWTPQPNGFPTVLVEPVPPVTSGVAATKCDAAQNIQTQIEGWITHVTNDFDTAVDIFAFGSAVIAAIADAILLILSAGALSLIETEIITAIGAAITGAWLAGKTVFSGYWTDEIKNKIFCAVFHHIGDDGSFTDAQFSDLWNDLNLHLTGSIAKSLFIGFLSSIGRQGLNAMAASGNSSGADCSGCDSTCTISNWHIVTYDGVDIGSIVSTGSNFIIVQGSGHPDFGTPYQAMIQTSSDDQCCTITNIEQLSGDGDFGFTGGVLCEDPRWPSSSNVTFSYPSDVNTVFIRKDSGTNFTAKITFG